jgi:hypothetical protein
LAAGAGGLTLQRMIRRFTAFAIASLLLAACSGSSSLITTPSTNEPADDGGADPGDAAPLDGALAARCRVACTAPDEAPCKSKDREACVRACVAKLGELEAPCATCLLKASYWSGTTCTSCALCSFDTRGVKSGCSGSTGSCCSAKDETCAFALPAPTESPCRAECLR